MTSLPTHEVAHYPRLSLAERDRRWSALRERMERDELDAIVTSPNTSRFDEACAYTRYLSQIGGSAVGASIVFPLDGEVTAIVPSVPGPERWAAIYDWIGDLRDIGVGFAYAPPIARRLGELGLANGRIGLTGLGPEARAAEGSFVHGIYEGIREALPKAQLVNGSDTVNDVRHVKSEEELEALRRSVENAEAMIRCLAGEAKPGVPENVVWARMVATLVERGGELPAVLLWAAGPIQRRSMFRPSVRPIERGDIITIEADGRYMGYNGQVTAHAFVGPIPELYRELHELQQQATARCYEHLVPGASVDDFTALCEDAVAGTGYQCRLVMHGRGLGDDPPIAIYRSADDKTSSLQIAANSVFAIKPKVSTGDPSAFGRGTEQQRFVYSGETVVASPTGAQRLGTRQPALVELAA
jgi:Xaa-Pro dipeptidase